MTLIQYLPKKVGCLLIHGFTGCPGDMEPLAEKLESEGFVVSCPTLAGHGQNRRFLNSTTYQQWIQSAQDAYRELLRNCDIPIIAGFSMGGLIGIHLASKYPAQALIALSTPIYCLNLREMFSQFVGCIRKKDWKSISQYASAMLGASPKAIKQFACLLDKTKPLLERIKCPALVVQSMKDVTVHWKSAPYIYESLSSNWRELFMLKKSSHMIFVDCEKHEVINKTREFIDRVLRAENIMPWDFAEIS